MVWWYCAVAHFRENTGSASCNFSVSKRYEVCWKQCGQNYERHLLLFSSNAGLETVMLSLKSAQIYPKNSQQIKTCFFPIQSKFESGFQCWRHLRQNISKAFQNPPLCTFGFAAGAKTNDSHRELSRPVVLNFFCTTPPLLFVSTPCLQIRCTSK